MTDAVAIVDDDPSIRRSVQNLLASAGFRTEAYPSAEAFLARAAPALPGCIVLDLRMQGMHGLDLLRQLGAAARVVILTGHGDDDARRQALEAGATAFLTKPFRADALLDAVRAALA